MCGVALYKEETFVYPETTYFVEGGNHSLDTPEDYTIGLEALKDIVRKYEEAMR